MKKLSILFLFIFIISSSTFAVDLIVGATAGFNGSWYSSGDWDDYIDDYYDANKMKPGMSFSLFFDIGFSPSFSLQPELWLVNNGAKATTSNIYNSTYDVYYDDELTESAMHLTVPLLFKYKIQAGSGKINLFAGPLVSLLLGEIKEKYKISVDGGGSNSDKVDIEADNKFHYGYAAGIGYEFPLGKGLFITDLRYSQILSSYYDDFDLKVNNFTASLGYGFRL